MKKLFIGLAAILTMIATLIPLAGNKVVAEEPAANPEIEIILHKRIARDVNVARDKDGTYQTFYQNDGLLYDDPGAVDGFDAKWAPINYANFAIYDVSRLYQAWQKLESKDKEFDGEKIESIEKLTQHFMDMKRSEFLDFVKRHGLQKTGVSYDANGNPMYGTVKTRKDQINGEEREGIGRIFVDRYYGGGDAAYLLFETSLDDNREINVNISEASSPMLVAMPQYYPETADELSEVHLYAKNVGYVRDPYFFKFGRDSDGKNEAPLEGAVFALFQYDDDGKKLYLDMNEDYRNDLKNKWINETDIQDPLTDQRVNKFTSDKDGLVNTGERFLPAGTYYFEELKSAEGYVIDERSKKIEVFVPKTWDDPVLVDGQPMDELVSGKVPETAYQKQTPRVYNTSTTKKPPVEEGSDSGSKKMLPKTGDYKTSMLLFGGLMILIAIFMIFKKKEGRSV